MKSPEGHAIDQIEQVIKDYKSGLYNTQYVLCECGKSEHSENAIYCSACGRKLEKAAGTTLSK